MAMTWGQIDRTMKQESMSGACKYKKLIWGRTQENSLTKGPNNTMRVRDNQSKLNHCCSGACCPTHSKTGKLEKIDLTIWGRGRRWVSHTCMFETLRCQPQVRLKTTTTYKRFTNGVTTNLTWLYSHHAKFQILLTSLVVGKVNFQHTPSNQLVESVIKLDAMVLVKATKTNQ